MARCACDEGECSCAVTGRDGISVTGAGTTDTPIRMDFDPGNGAAAGCERIMDCVGSNLADGLRYDDAANRLHVHFSTDPGNVAAVGTDSGIYVVAASEIDPPGYAWGTTTDRTITAELEDMILTPQLEDATPGDFTISGTSVIVARPGVWFFQGQFRYEVDFDYSVDPPSGIVYGRISGTGRGRNQGQVVSRDSGVYGMDYTVMMPFPDPNTSVEFYVQRSAIGWGVLPVASCWWSAKRLGDIPT